MPVAASRTSAAPAPRLDMLRVLEQKILWLAVWMIHHANQVRPKRDFLKVGGHQASSASVASIMTALYLDVLTPHDRVAVKPHASPIFHAIQYLFGRLPLDAMRNFRGLGGVQSYPSRTKDVDDVDFSTGSVGLGVAMTSFAALVQDYVELKSMMPPDRRGRMVAIVGDAELDEGNVFEALLEGWKHDIRNVWWIIDYNRQSLDAVVSDRLFTRLDTVFQDMGWNVVTLKDRTPHARRIQPAWRRCAETVDRRVVEHAVLGALVPGWRGVASSAACGYRLDARRRGAAGIA
ncbi:MAG: 1-deoxy-D-xylulose-5-phosphate synthase N-terminal domain-containing protein [Vicinamibacterales bacterium]